MDKKESKDECCICLENINKINDIKLTCCCNYLHKKCFNYIMEKFLECPLCQEYILLELPVKKKWYLTIFKKEKISNKRKFIVQSQDDMIYYY